MALSTSSQLSEGIVWKVDVQEGVQAPWVEHLKKDINAAVQGVLQTNPGALVGLDTLQQLNSLDAEDFSSEVAELQERQAKLAQAVNPR